MGNEFINASIGKSFDVALESMLGSTNWGWCLESLPAGIVLAGQEIRPKTQRFIGPVDQVFYFLVADGAEGGNAELSFGLYCLHTGKKDRTVTVAVNINVEMENSPASFLRYSENEAVYAEPRELSANLMYGYPCDREATLIDKYGYPCGVAESANLKSDSCVVAYGYPYLLKYGYPCMVKYGYPNCE